MDLSQAAPLLQNSQQVGPGHKQRVFTGVVTSMHDYYGLVDEEVLFQLSVVKGRVPLVGEKVLVKAIYNPGQSMKWNAQKVQAVNNQSLLKSLPSLLPAMGQPQKQGILGNKPQPLLQAPIIPPLIPSMQQPPQKPGLLQTPPHLYPHPHPHPQHQHPRQGQFDPRGGGRRRHGDGGRRAGRWDDGGGWCGDRVSQKRRKLRGTQEEPLKKASVQPPRYWPLFSRFSRDSSACDTLEVLRRYPQLALPDDFFDLRLSWVETFPATRPLTLGFPTPFHVSEPRGDPDPAQPADVDPSYSAKVMLLSTPGLEEMYQKCCSLSEEQKEVSAGPVHPTALIKFLVGLKQEEAVVLGGAWSPSLDGSKPVKDPLVLIRTAVRCTKAQTGLDLSTCSQWFKFAEVRYLRAGLVETTVFFLPDVWHCLPSMSEWEGLLLAHNPGTESSRSPASDQAVEENAAVDSRTPEPLGALPDEPALLVHPREGLPCATLPLGSLLKYRNSPGHSSFEVSLMAELFNEMLQRDFGLRIYRALHSIPGRAPAQPGSQGAAESQDVHMTPVEPQKDEEEEGVRKEGAEPPRSEERRKMKEEALEVDYLLLQDDDKDDFGVGREEGEMNPVLSHHSDPSSTKETDKEPCSSLVLSRDVLLAFVYFDHNFCGFLLDKDLEEIVLSLGLHLSRAQVTELVTKVVTQNACHYQGLAERWERDTEPRDSKTLAADPKLQGNVSLLPPVSVKGSGRQSQRSGSGGSELVTYNGAAVHLGNLLQKLERVESTRVHLEDRIRSLEARLGEAGEQVSLEEAQRKRLASGLEAAQKSLAEALDKLKTEEKRSASYEKLLKESKGNMVSVIEKMQSIVNKTCSVVETGSDASDKV
ncbi:cell cycle and apoptosis regulator protein 2 [Acipenser oxyrinchus oxyrinchus]|uniref:Cell cycle and apoptosis regulator protein 2 n=1 Tax=Acipenser oxyrinchus oxyrinchus TaxID=40147 RepID=A0AAD8FR82_ACIOX|nr:cell cycle and apoptosis regulator protein 2 [Acipenser oxyrinchus oxyrinchus]